MRSAVYLGAYIIVITLLAILLGGAWGTAVVLSIVLLGALPDIAYSLATASIVRRFWKPRLASVFAPVDIKSRVLPCDVDWLMHMNNARYLTHMDFGRWCFVLQSGLYQAARSRGGGVLLGAASIRFRRELRPFQAFTLRSKLLTWDKKNLYIEQRFIGSNGFVHAIAFCQMPVLGVSLAELLPHASGGASVDPARPPKPSPDLSKWLECIAASSAALRAEAGLS